MSTHLAGTPARTDAATRLLQSRPVAHVEPPRPAGKRKPRRPAEAPAEAEE